MHVLSSSVSRSMHVGVCVSSIQHYQADCGARRQIENEPCYYCDDSVWVCVCV